MFVLSHIHDALKAETARLRKRDAILSAFLTDVQKNGCWIDKKFADSIARALEIVDKHNLAPSSESKDSAGRCPPAEGEISELSRPVWGSAQT